MRKLDAKLIGTTAVVGLVPTYSGLIAGFLVAQGLHASAALSTEIQLIGLAVGGCFGLVLAGGLQIGAAVLRRRWRRLAV